MRRSRSCNGLSVKSVHEDGPDPLIVLVHGALDRSASFARSIRHLRGLAILRYDRRGYGRSLCSESVGLDAHVEDLLSMIGARRVVLVGHSFGGVIALSAAQRCPEQVLSVGAFETPLMWRSWWPSVTPGNAAVAKSHEGASSEEAGEAFMISLIGEQRWLELPSKVKADRRKEGATLVAELVSIDPESPPWDPASFELPILAGYGDRSKPYLIKAAQTLAAEALNGECMIIENSGHGAHLSQPEQFAAFIRRAFDMGLARIDH